MKNILPRDDLRGLSRKKASPVVTQTIPKGALDEYEANGWTLARKNKKSFVVSKPKSHGVLLEDRVWTLLYRMGFPYLSGDGGAELSVDPDADHDLSNQVDVVAIDDEMVIAVECKSALTPTKRPNFQGELAKHGLHRKAISKATLPSTDNKRTTALAIFTLNAVLSDNDRSRAEDQQVSLFDQDDLSYYENLIKHLGPAGRYQFLSDLVPGRLIPGLSIRVPALKARMGGYNTYTFSIHPDYLLKIAYVSHRAKGKASDLDTYQRMVSKARLKKIAEYITDDGIFPTNIVINIETGKLTFDRAKQAEESEGGAEFGWLTLKAAYKSAWIIDGQHRLFAYSGHARATSAVLAVLAFEGLPGSSQQKLFSDINAKQKSVKQSLLQELYADLHLTSDNPAERTKALISRSIQALGQERDSPLYDRILLADSTRTPTRCVSLTSLFSAVEKPGFYYGAVRKNVVIDPGPFWTDDSKATIKRTTAILKSWLLMVREAAPSWWELGADEGGGLAMNDGITVCVNTLRSVFEHLSKGKTKLADLSMQEVIERITPFGEALGQYFAAMDGDQRRAFRALRGVQGQTSGMRHAQAALQSQFPEFQPEGLNHYLDMERAQTNDQAAVLIRQIETLLHKTVLEELKRNYVETPDQWWFDGVPQSARTQATGRREDDKGKAGGNEAYLDVIHYRDIALHNWGLFSELLAYGSGDKSKKTSWIAQVNEIRKGVMHASRGSYVTYEQLGLLQSYLRFLKQQTSGEASAADAAEDLG